MSLDLVLSQLPSLSDADLDVVVKRCNEITAKRASTPNDAEMDLWAAGRVRDAIVAFRNRAAERSVLGIAQSSEAIAQALSDAVEKRNSVALAALATPDDDTLF